MNARIYQALYSGGSAAYKTVPNPQVMRNSRGSQK
jgi:hypothetical protein